MRSTSRSRFDPHLLAERLEKSERLSVRDRIVSDKTTNQRLMQQCALNENKDLEIKTDPVVLAAGPTGTTDLSAPDSSDNVNDLIINAFIHASTLNYNAKVITREFNHPGMNWNTGSCQSCKDESSSTIDSSLVGIYISCADCLDIALNHKPYEQWNPGRTFRPVGDSSAGCTFNSELMFTLELEPSTIRFKDHRAIHLAIESSYHIKFFTICTKNIVASSGIQRVSSYLRLFSWMYLHFRVDVHSATRTQYHSLQTPSHYPLSY
ncbi:unnamed protein product [Schistosoma mattheei]|uniref:Uncharacterized protein n=1 Tax=Schistosoma mattheei TaxID=31246 RepID=A0A183NE26_9TREM|nr:unnamed protein product [Schistosoma mattheei]